METDQKQDLLNSYSGKQWKDIHISPHHGIALPLFSLLSQNSCGIGEYPDLLPLIDWCRELGLNVIQLLPLNDTGNENSPYSALTAFGLNPIHLGLHALPYLENHPSLIYQINELKKNLPKTQRIDYYQVRKAKFQFLDRYYRECGREFQDNEEYRQFVKDNEFWLIPFALFKTLKIERGWQSWLDWPKEEFHQLKAQHKEQMAYHALIQYLCFKQMKQIKEYATKNKVYIKGDIPILINRESADVWHYSYLFHLEYSAGAPPDMFAKDGQNWGFPLYRWENIAKEDYVWWRKRLQLASHFYHLYRIDHVVGFYRIWAIPTGSKGREGKYLPEDPQLWIPQGSHIMKMMLDSCEMLPIGEDLGNVPSEVRNNMRELGICGTKVVRWERYWEGDKTFIPYENYPFCSMTTVSTHDSETLQQWWRNNPKEAEQFSSFMKWQYNPELSLEHHRQILHDSHHTQSLFHVNLLQEYFPLIAEMTWPDLNEERINIPGIVSDFNWSYRYRKNLEEILSNEELKSLLRQLIV